MEITQIASGIGVLLHSTHTGWGLSHRWTYSSVPWISRSCQLTGLRTCAGREKDVPGT